MALNSTVTGDSGLIAAAEDELDTAATAAATTTASGHFRELSIVSVDENAATPVKYANWGVTEQTLFELNSISKPMLGHLFAWARSRGIVTTTTTLGDVFGDDLTDAGLEAVTFKLLCMHRGGLNTNPTNAASTDWLALDAEATAGGTNPWLGWELADLLRHAEENFEDDATVGAFTYSNIGGALVGQGLAELAGVTYKELIEDYLFKRCHMDSALLAVTVGDLPSDHIVGYKLDGTENEPRVASAYSPARAVWANTRDLGRFIRSVISGYAPGMGSTYPQIVNSAFTERSPGWFWSFYPAADTGTGSDELRHSGTSYGFRARVIIDRKKRKGLAMVSNVGTDTAINAALPLFRGLGGNDTDDDDGGI